MSAPECELTVPAVKAELGHGAVLSELGLTLPANLDWEDWTAVGERLAELQRRADAVRSALSWAIGQWLAYGEHRFGERYAQAADDLGLAPGRLMNMAYVARAFDGRPTHPALSFSHHAEVASLPDPVRAAILDEAVETGLSVHEVRVLARKARAAANGEEPHEAEAKDLLTRALQEVRNLPPDRWAWLIYWALKPMLRAPGFGAELVERIRADITAT